MVKKEGLVSKIIGIVILVIIIVVVIVLKNNGGLTNVTTPVYSATGGGKEDLLADEDIKKIFANDYKIELVNDVWSNGKTIKVDVVRENGDKYDLIFFSDQRFHDYYKTPPKEGEANRYPVLKSDATLNTPIVIYSWKNIVNALIKEKIVTLEDGVYYITDMKKLIDYILEGKKWSDIGVDNYGSINIGSVDPVTSSPGATYYGLLLSIMTDGTINDETVAEALPKLKTFYEKSGYMNNTPADLFSMFLKTGEGAKPMIVDYEKSIIDFANTNPEGWAAVKDKVVVLYPKPTIWNSHYIAALSENGSTVIEAFNDKKVSKIAWEKYGFRVGYSGGVNDVKSLPINGIPSEITKVTDGLKMEYYNQLIDYLSGKTE